MCVQALVHKLPRKTGYFHEMRSAMPQILYSGAHELAFDIFLDFKAVMWIQFVCVS